jgi:uncharacterized protein (TIGR00369 family)
VNTFIEKMIDASAIAHWLGFSVEQDNGEYIYRLAFDEKHIGNPAIRALHGGVIAAFLEVAAQCELAGKLDNGETIKTINVDIDYLASSRAQDMKGRASITRLGRRIAFVEAIGWQESEDRPVAKANFRIRIGGGK